jgi:hypothetical protein
MIVETAGGWQGLKWSEFRDEYGDTGRDMALYLGPAVVGDEAGRTGQGGRVAELRVWWRPMPNATNCGWNKIARR